MDTDEFGMLHENAEEAGLPWDGAPPVRRTEVELPGGGTLSCLRWGDGPPELVLVHGGAQNAHTWDTVALALDRPLLAVDLPGHGRSSWREDHDYGPVANSEAVAVAVERLAPDAAAVVGMSLGGLTSIALAARRPDLVRRLVIVDVTPGTDREKAAPIVAFVSGPPRFESFEEILERTVAFNPTRSVSSLRRGVLHNAHQLEDGSWAWRYDHDWSGGAGTRSFVDLWEDLAAVTAPVMLVVGGESGVTDDDDRAELRRRQPGARVEVVAGAGHSIQGDRPVELARLVEDFLRAPERA